MSEEERVKAELSEKHSEVLNTSEMTAKYQALGFLAPWVHVERREDGVRGTMEFTHSPRFYFHFVPE